MWIVVIVEPYYPTVKHYDNEEDARKQYERYKGSGFVTHLAEVKEKEVNHEYMSSYARKYEKPKDLDVEW